ncbi:hypothetical protein T484DRAFT_1891735 [Baffinella frigidus]|nr:hypothetical protein T484DRAFT_1891735 [Cryptophyta sp. CCMP2293]
MAQMPSSSDETGSRMLAYRSMMSAALEGDDKSFADIVSRFKPKTSFRHSSSTTSTASAFHASTASIRDRETRSRPSAFRASTASIQSRRSSRSSMLAQDLPREAQERLNSRSSSTSSVIRTAQDLASAATNPRCPPRGEGISPLGGARRFAPPAVLNTKERALVSELRAEIQPSSQDFQATAREARARMHKSSSAPGKGLPQGGGVSPMGGARRDAPPEVLNSKERALVSQLRAEMSAA